MPLQIEYSSVFDKQMHPGVFLQSRFGTWTIQKLVESLGNEEQIRIAKGKLAGQVVELTKCPNGNHVIKYCLQTLTPADNQVSKYL
jgi:hypothetical protein